jgi:hypothetical protein
LILELILATDTNICCSTKYCKIFVYDDRAIAQAVNQRLPTAVALVWAQIRSCGICGGQSSTGAGFLSVLRFPLSIVIPPTAQHSSSSGAAKVGQLVADIPSGVSLTPPPQTKTKKTKTIYMTYFS